MRIKRLRLAQGWWFVLVCLFSFTPLAAAVDGVIEINQDRAVAGGVTASDAAGFPVTIDSPGSYRLTGNLTLSADGDAIFITAENVTLDLNGFAIIGPSSGSGTGVFVDPSPPAGRSNVNVSNGSVIDMGGNGLELRVAASVHQVTATHNGGHGIVTLGGSRVTHSTANRNTLNGIQVGDGCLVTSSTANNNEASGIATGARSTVTNNVGNSNGGHGIVTGEDSVMADNTANANGLDGINAGRRCTVTGNAANNNGQNGIQTANRCAVVRNTANANTGVGLQLGVRSGYANNVVNNNGTTVTGGIEMSTNICDNTTTCP